MQFTISMIRKILHLSLKVIFQKQVVLRKIKRALWTKEAHHLQFQLKKEVYQEIINNKKVHSTLILNKMISTIIHE